MRRKVIPMFADPCVCRFLRVKSVMKCICYLDPGDSEMGTDMFAGNFRSELMRNTCSQRQGC